MNYALKRMSMMSIVVINKLGRRCHYRQQGCGKMTCCQLQELGADFAFLADRLPKCVLV